MEFDHESVRQVVEEDRLSRLPDELIHKILSSLDMKFAVQMCLLILRREFLWTSLPCLNFSNVHFGNFHKFEEFVIHVLTQRNHQTEVSSVKLNLYGKANDQVFERKILSYAFSHNVQELAVFRSSSSHQFYPLCMSRSESLKHFTLTCSFLQICDATLDFPALTTLHLKDINLCGDLFSKCVNLKKLTLESFHFVGMEKASDIITPRLSNLVLIDGVCLKVMNVIAPQLENLTVTNCSIKYLNAPPGLSSFCYTSWLWPSVLLQFSNDPFHSLNKVRIIISFIFSAYKKKDARKIINMLQGLHSTRYLTLDSKIVECLLISRSVIAKFFTF